MSSGPGFNVGVTIHLVDKVSAAMGVVRGQFATTATAAAALQSRLDKIHGVFNKGLIMTGGAMALAAPLVAATKSAEEYTHQLNMMRSAGLSNKEMAESISAAWKTTNNVISSTATENLKVIMDLRSVFGKTSEGIEYMPRFAKIQGAYSSVLDGKLSAHSDELSFAMAKALDMIGKVKNASEFNKGSEAMFRVTEATGGRVTPADYQAVFKYARQAKYGMNDQFLYKVMPELILENKTGAHGGASGVGTQMQALYRFGVQGIMTVRAAQKLAEMDLIKTQQVLKTTTTGTTLKERKKGELVHGGVERSDLLAANPFEWVHKVYIPKLAKAYKLRETDTDQLVQASNQVFKGNALATSLVGELIKKKQQYGRFGGMYDKTDTVDQAYARGQKNDPKQNWKNLAAAMENVKVAFGEQIIPVIIPYINKFAQALQKFGKYMHDNPELTKTVVKIVAFSAALLAFGGILNIVRAGFMGLGVIFGPIGSIVKLIGPFVLRFGANLLALRAPLMFAFGILSKFWVPLAIITTVITGIILVIQNWDTIMKVAKTAIDAVSNAFRYLVSILPSVATQLGGFLSKIPFLGGAGQVISAAGNAAQALLQANANNGGQPTVVNQTNHIIAQMPAGHDHEKCANVTLKKLASNAAHKASASSGGSVGRSHNQHGNHKP